MIQYKETIGQAGSTRALNKQRMTTHMPLIHKEKSLEVRVGPDLFSQGNIFADGADKWCAAKVSGHEVSKNLASDYPRQDWICLKIEPAEKDAPNTVGLATPMLFESEFEKTFQEALQEFPVGSEIGINYRGPQVYRIGPLVKGVWFNNCFIEFKSPRDTQTGKDSSLGRKKTYDFVASKARLKKLGFTSHLHPATIFELLYQKLTGGLDEFQDALVNEIINDSIEWVEMYQKKTNNWSFEIFLGNLEGIKLTQPLLLRRYSQGFFFSCDQREKFTSSYESAIKKTEEGSNPYLSPVIKYSFETLLQEHPDLARKLSPKPEVSKRLSEIKLIFALQDIHLITEGPFAFGENAFRGGIQLGAASRGAFYLPQTREAGKLTLAQEIPEQGCISPIVDSNPVEDSKGRLSPAE